MGMHWVMEAVDHNAFTARLGSFHDERFPTADQLEDLMEEVPEFEELVSSELLPPMEALTTESVARLTEVANVDGCSPMLLRLDQAVQKVDKSPPAWREGLCYYAPAEAAELLLELHALRPVVAGWEDWWPQHFEQDFVERVAAAATTQRGLFLQHM